MEINQSSQNILTTLLFKPTISIRTIAYSCLVAVSTLLFNSETGNINASANVNENQKMISHKYETWVYNSKTKIMVHFKVFS